MTEFLHKLVDWKEFELFVTDLYKYSDEVIVEHNVIEIGKSSVPRQIDVRVIHKTKLHTYKTIIECKSWKHSVDRAKIDILASYMEDLNASKGAIFTTKGYQEGAVEYAKYKSIDIFIVRDLTEEEWGKPGRHIMFYLQFLNASITNFSPIKADFKPTNANPPKDFKLNIQIKKDFLDENQYLVSTVDERKGKHIVEILNDVRIKLLKTIGEQTGLIKIDNKTDKVQIGFKTKVHIDFSEWEFCQFKYPFGFIKINDLEFEVLSTIDQNVFKTDRAEQLDFALVVENYITKQRNVVTKAKTFSAFNILEQLKDNVDNNDGEALVNGSIIKIYFEPYVSIDLKAYTIVKQTEDLKLKPKIA
jgi:hypothetical protein